VALRATNLNQVVNSQQQRSCAICKGVLPPTKSRSKLAFGGNGRQRQYCSNRCRQKAKRAWAMVNGNEHSNRSIPSPRDGAMTNLPLLQPPDSEPLPYRLWTPREKQRYGISNARVQWQLQKCLNSGMSLADAATDVGIPLTAIQSCAAKNPSFTQLIHRAREWAKKATR
jgi:hypothetical protein